MEKVLRKRAWRDLKENKFRYFALAFLIIISMYLVISLVGAADTIVDGTTKQAKKHKLEDGQFQVFVPLTTKQKENFTKKGLTVEETFYLDFRQKDGSKLRIFKNRKKVNKINLDEGRLAKNKSEVVVEKRYAQEHNLKTGSKITIDGNFYKITGIGSVPDYDACYEKLSDSTVDSKQFGLAFVTEDAYENLKDNENSIQSEEYIYAYRLNGAMTQKQLKNKLKKITFNPDDVDDPYFKDYWEETAGKKDDIKDGIKKLTDASTQMSDGLNKLSENNETLQKGANQIFQAYLKTAESQLTSFGVTSLTENNYANILKSLIAKSSDGLTRLSLESAKEQLDALKTYRDGIKAYTNGVKKASDGSSKLKEGTDQLEEGTKELMKAFDMETSNLTQFLKADDNIRIGAAAGDQVISKLAGMVAGVIIMILFTYVISVFVIHEIEKENSIIGTLYAGENNETLQKGANQIFQAYLKTAESQLTSFGVTSLTENNYANILKSLIAKSSDGLTRLSLESAKEQLDALKTYRDGIKAYTNGVKKASDGSSKLKEGTDQLEEGTKELMKAFDMETSNLTQFLKADDNIRIGAAAGDQVISKLAGMVAGVIIMILFTYVISVFVIHEIEKENSIIGTLYALGVIKKQLLKYYLTVPVIVTFLAGLAGTIIGYSPIGIPTQMQDCYDYFSIPDLSPELLIYLLVYGIVMPPLVAVIVNYFVIRKKLSRPALSMIRNEQKKSHISKVKLGNMPFLTKFRIRQSLREARAGFTVVFGMFIALLVMMIGLDCYVMCDHISKENKKDTKFEYMYTYKYPDKKVPKGGDACFVKGLHKEVWGYDLEISLIGIENDNPYFSQDKDLPKAKNKVVISSAMAQKYDLKKGDSIILSDEEDEMDYAFQVADIKQYSSGLYAFMDIDSMRDLFQTSSDYYNMVVSKKKLSIDSGKLYATTSKKAIEESSDVFINMMIPMMGMIVGLSVIIFAIVMYLMIKVMIDRSAQNIALMKVFGYRKKEIKKLYLDENFYMIAIGALISVPLSKKLMDAMYPVMVSNIACGMNLSFTWQMYALIYAGIIITYLVINKLLVRKIYKVGLSDALKNRE